MIITLALLLAPSPLPATTVPSVSFVRVDEELDTKIAAAGEDVEALWAIRVWLIEQDRTGDSRAVLERILEIDENHEDAHSALSHHNYDGQWFTSYAALSSYRREEAKRMKEKGLVRFGDGWAPEADVPYLRMGWEQLDDGSWMSGIEIARIAHDAEMEAKGWSKQDTTWISPEEVKQAAGFVKCDAEPESDAELECAARPECDGGTGCSAGFWKCGEEWLSAEDANAYHAKTGQWWHYPSEHYIALSTLDRLGTTWVGYWADHTYDDLVRILGLEPEQPPQFITFGSIDQYNDFAAGNQEAQRAQTETDGFSSLHYAYFADSYIDVSTGTPQYMGCGVSYWDPTDENLSGYGQHAIRHAAAQSYMESVDPSWMTISELFGGQAQINSTAGFWAEKDIPKWLRYGAASFVERYFIDAFVGEDGDPTWARTWGLQNLQAKGGLRSLEQLFEFPLNLEDIPGSTQFFHEAGAVVAFMLDGGCEPVTKAHEAFRTALVAGEDTAPAVAALQEALIEAEEQLRAFAQG